MPRNFELVNKCDLCGNNKPELYLSAKDRNYQTGDFNYLKCPKCNLVWLSPRPNEKSIEKYYPKNYKAHQIVLPPSVTKLKVRQFIYKHNILARLLIKDQLFFLKNKGKILDVGAGNGGYLRVLTGWGWESFGVELNKISVKNARKAGINNISEGDLISAKYQENTFDVVRYSHVFEHIPSPSQQLKEVKRILKKKGHVIIIVPNINSMFFKIFKTYWYSLDPPRHLFQYSDITLTKLLKKSGYRQIEIRYNQSPYTFIRSLYYRLNINKVGSRYGIIVYPLGTILRILNLLKMSDTIEVSAQK